MKFYLFVPGTENLPALRPADGGVGEEGGADGEQPTAQGQRESHTRVLRAPIP